MEMHLVRKPAVESAHALSQIPNFFLEPFSLLLKSPHLIKLLTRTQSLMLGPDSRFEHVDSGLEIDAFVTGQHSEQDLKLLFSLIVSPVFVQIFQPSGLVRLNLQSFEDLPNPPANLPGRGSEESGVAVSELRGQPIGRYGFRIWSAPRHR